MGEIFFSEKGFQNWKKVIEKFTTHEGSLSHTEANVKWMAIGRPTIGSQLCSQTLQVQKTRRADFLCQLRAVQYLARQGITFQGHTELDGNLKQQLLTWNHEVAELKIWVKSNKLCCHQTVNEIISIMGQNLLPTLLEKIQANNPPWFSVITDEATDVCNSAQLNLFIRWVNNKYEILGDTTVIQSPKYKSRNFIHGDQRPPYKMQSYIFSVSWTSLRWCSKHARKEIWSSSQISE